MGTLTNNGTVETDYATSIDNRTAEDPANPGAFLYGANGPTTHGDFDQFYQPINTYFQGSAGGTYTVTGGETLESIAAELYGDAALWYRIAEVNGLSRGAELSDGTILTFRLDLSTQRKLHP